MNPDIFNMSLRKFLKRVGVTSQRELEDAVKQALDSGQLQGHEALNVKMTLQVGELKLEHIVDDKIRLE